MIRETPRAAVCRDTQLGLTSGAHVVTILVMGTEKHVQAAEFKAKCLDIMDRVAASGEAIVITKRGKPVARLCPVTEMRDTIRGFMKGDIVTQGDIVSPIDEPWEAGQ